MSETSSATRERDLAEIRAQVEGERDRLSRELARLRGDNGGGTGKEAPFHEHPTEHAGEMEEHERLMAIRENLEQMYDQCQEALGRLDRGEYGICRGCGKEIDIERLKALPYATRCIPCKEARRD